MITLHIAPQKPQHQALKERLENMALARQVVESPATQQPSLSHGEEYHTGEKAIHNYLDGLEGFMASWYECRCDKWPED